MSKKTLVCCNALTSIDSSAYLTHCQMWYRIGRDFPDEKFIFYVPNRVSIDNARNSAARLAMEQDCDYLFFIDDDMQLHEKTFASLREADKDVVMALSYVRGYPFHPMFFIDKSKNPDKIEGLEFFDDFEEHIDPKTFLVECDAIGCATVLIKVDLIKKLQAPYFVTSPQATEDVYFCLKAKNTLGPKNVSIFVDCGVPTGHLGEKAVFTFESIKYYKKLMEEMNPGLLEKSDQYKDRGDEYLAKIGEM